MVWSSHAQVVWVPWVPSGCSPLWLQRGKCSQYSKSINVRQRICPERARGCSRGPAAGQECNRKGVGGGEHRLWLRADPALHHHDERSRWHFQLSDYRSEERGVGEECRSRWSP